MKNQIRNRQWAALACAGVLYTTIAMFSQEAQVAWTSLPDIDSLTDPAIAEHTDNRVHVAVVAFNGLVATTSTDTPGAWTPWQILGPVPCSPSPCPDQAFYADPETAPVFLKEGTTLYLFARGKDDNLHVIQKSGTGAWASQWQRITSDGRVRGRISVAFRQPIATGTLEIHVIYVSGENEVEYREFDASWGPAGEPRQWCNAQEGTLGSDGSTYLCAAIRQSKELVFEIRSGAWPFEQTARRLAQGSQGAIVDHSRVVYFAGAFHAAYTQRSGPFDGGLPRESLRHALVWPAQSDFNSGGIINATVPAGGNPVLSDLAVYRNKLFAVYADAAGTVRYARWDTADPKTPWVGNVSLDAAFQTDHRPALAPYNRLPLATNPDYAQPNFGNDLLAVMTERSGQQPRTINLSRASAIDSFDSQIQIYNYGADSGCPDQSDPGAPVPVGDIRADGRPFLTELGYILWSLPHWLSGHVYKDAAMLGCMDGNDTGRFDPPCGETRYPVIIKSGGGIYVCSGAWLNQAGDYLHIWDELGHSICGPLGFSDNNGSPPQSVHASATGIALGDLLDGFDLFGQRVGQNCPAGMDATGRCRGFTGHANNYDSNSRQHSFMYVVRYYIANGDQLRRWVRDDLAAGDDLLQLKYQWVRLHLFRGVEFRGSGEPIFAPNDPCFKPIRIREGIQYTGTTEGARPDGEASAGNSSASPDVWYAYTATCTGTMTVNTCGSSFDTVLSVHDGCPGTTANEIASNDDCTGGACGGQDSCLTVAIVEGQTYWVRVSGFAGARGDFRLNLSTTCPWVPLAGSYPDRYDFSQTRNDTFASSAVIPDVIQESRLIPGMILDRLNHDTSDDIDFFTVQLPDASGECCAEPLISGTLQGQFRVMVHPQIYSPFEIAIYRTDGTVLRTGYGSSLALDCPRDAFPDGRITFSVRDPNCRNTFDVSLWYRRCDRLFYKPWYLEYDPPLFNWTIPAYPDWLQLSYPLDPEVMDRHLAGELEPPYPAELLRFDRKESGPFNVGLLLPGGCALALELLDDNGELIEVGSWREATPIHLPIFESDNDGSGGGTLSKAVAEAPLVPAPNPETLPVPIPLPFLYLAEPDLPAGTYYLRIQGAEIGIPYVLHSFSLAEIVNINCGFEDDITDGLGRVWLRDEPFLISESQGTALFSVTNAIDASRLRDPGVPQQMLESERWADGDIHYGVPLPKGDYDVTLYFSENWSPAVNPLLGGDGCLDCTRRFDVEVEDQRVFNFSPADAAAGVSTDGIGAIFTATELRFEVRVEDDRLDVSLFDLGAGNPPENVALKGITVRALSRQLPWLRIGARPDGTAAVSWPAYLDATVQSAPNVPGPFNTDPGPVIREELFNVLNLSPENNRRFYRLLLPR